MPYGDLRLEGQLVFYSLIALVLQSLLYGMFIDTSNDALSTFWTFRDPCQQVSRVKGILPGASQSNSWAKVGWTYPFDECQPTRDVVPTIGGRIDVYFGSTIEKDVGLIQETVRDLCVCGWMAGTNYLDHRIRLQVSTGTLERMCGVQRERCTDREC